MFRPKSGFFVRSTIQNNLELLKNKVSYFDRKVEKRKKSKKRKTDKKESKATILQFRKKTILDQKRMTRIRRIWVLLSILGSFALLYTISQLILWIFF